MIIQASFWMGPTEKKRNDRMCGCESSTAGKNPKKRNSHPHTWPRDRVLKVTIISSNTPGKTRTTAQDGGIDAKMGWIGGPTHQTNLPIRPGRSDTAYTRHAYAHSPGELGRLFRVNTHLTRQC